MKKRIEAKKVFVAEIVRGKYFPGNAIEKTPSYVISSLGEKIIRASISGTIVEKFDSGIFSSLTINDGTETIRIKSFGNLDFSKFEVGDIVNVIGKIKEYNGETYLNAEIVRRINFEQEIFEKLKTMKRIFGKAKIVEEIRKIANKFDESFAIEYGKEKFGLDEKTVQQILIPKEIDYSEKIFEIIKSLDKGDGIDASQIFSVSKLPEQIVENAISELLSAGKIYEPKPGRFKCIDMKNCLKKQ